MSKGPTKAQQALAEAREWIEASKEEVKEREAALIEAQGQLVMHETIYAILEKTLTRQSSVKSSAQKSTTKRTRKKSSSKSASKSSRASSLAEQIKSGRIVAIDMASKEPICSTCGNVEDFEDHFKPSPHYHEFDAGKSSAPRAGEKSSTNGGASDDEQVSAASGD